MALCSILKNPPKPTLSLEFFPPAEESQMPAFYEVVDRLGVLRPLFASVTYGAGGNRPQNTLKVTGELIRRGWDVLAHLTCMGADPRTIRDFLIQMRDLGAHNVLALRGDPPRHADLEPGWEERTPFRHAADLVRFIHDELPDMCVGVAAYPFPHPESASFSEDRAHLVEKLRAGASFAITQLFFDVREYEALVSDLRSKGCDLPIVPGILPVRSFQSLRRILSLSGIPVPGKLYLALEEADARGGAEAVREVGTEFAVRQIRQLLDCGAPGIHLYTLNKAGMCLEVAREAGLA